jgi:hypothetical protein
VNLELLASFFQVLTSLQLALSGATVIFVTFVEPFLVRNEAQIDGQISSVQVLSVLTLICATCNFLLSEYLENNRPKGLFSWREFFAIQV